MSSATSIDGAAAPVADADTPVAAGHRASQLSRKNAPASGDPAKTDKDSFRPWHFFVLASLLAATAAVIMARQSRPEQLVLLSLTIGAAGFAAAALYRTLVPLVSPHAALTSFDQLTDSMRAVLEREKALTLRAIKELEFDRAMGKVSPKDFEEMAGRLRARAISLMKQLDAGGPAYRELIERELSARVSKRKSAPAGAAKAQGSAIAASGIACACGTTNDQDAAFCKRCGTRLAHVTGS